MEKEYMEMIQRNMAMSSMSLLFEEKPDIPSDEEIVKRLKEKGYNKTTVWTSDDLNMRTFYLLDRVADFKDAKNVPFQLAIITPDSPKTNTQLDELVYSQFWNTPNGKELLDSCLWQIFLRDMMGSAHLPKTRAQILSDWLEIALEMSPSCKAIWFDSSQNILTAKDARNNPYKDFNRIFNGAVNARFVNIGETDGEMLVDTLGLHVYGIPDIQVHFHKLNPDNVVNLAYNLAIYQFENDMPIKDNETVDGFDENGTPITDVSLRWKCQYEISLLEPKREVLDINAGIFAAGDRLEGTDK